MWKLLYSMLGLYRDNGKENRKHGMLRLYRDNGKKRMEATMLEI